MAAKADVRRIPLDRRICTIGEDRIDIRPSRGAIALPLTFVVVSIGCFVIVGLTIDLLPLVALALLLIPGLIAFPLGAMALMYSLTGAHVIIDGRKQSATFQQGVLGLGLGAREVVLFAKIDHVALEEASLGEEGSRELAAPVELRGWEVVLVKTNDKRLSIGMAIGAVEEGLAEEALARARQVAEAVAGLVARPLRAQEH
jgi:prepilin signal peptidase PulO-like enzyme (type II secretory pathway)